MSGVILLNPSYETSLPGHPPDSLYNRAQVELALVAYGQVCDNCRPNTRSSLGLLAAPCIAGASTIQPTPNVNQAQKIIRAITSHARSGKPRIPRVFSLLGFPLMGESPGAVLFLPDLLCSAIVSSAFSMVRLCSILASRKPDKTTALPRSPPKDRWKGSHQCGLMPKFPPRSLLFIALTIPGQC